jgi:uncharacterized phage protein (TIGR02220 family)
MKTEVTIKDGRKRNWWWARNEIFDQWGPILKSNGLAVYLCLCRHANDHAECWPSFQRIARECGVHRTTVIKNIKLLESYQLIRSESRLSNSGDPDTNTYTILDIPEPPLESSNSNKNKTKPTRGSRSQLPPVVAENNHPSSPELLPVVAENDYGSSPGLPKGNTIKETNFKETNLRKPPFSSPKGDTGTTEEKKGSTKKKSKEDNHQAKEVIDYLNKATGRQFKHTTSHLRHIEARFKEGFTTNELKLVVNFKARQWIDDPKMSQYLRPSTLFGTKADDYLQAAIQAGGNPEDPEAVVGISVTNNSIESKTEKRDYYYAKAQPNYQPRRIPQTPWEKTEAAFKRVSQSTHTIDESGNPINDFNNDDYAF